MSKTCEICDTDYIFEDECPICKPYKDFTIKTIKELIPEVDDVVTQIEAETLNELLKKLV